MGLVEHNPASHFDVKAMTDRPKFIVRHSTYTHSLQPTILNDNISQFKIGLELDKGYFTLKVKIMTLMSH
jgi:hypothetical protein